jgi:mRNA interferase HicA|tara:strand:- start:338 stop:496 length:159 start_codon:yes stop_codon:yes gene_type:complete
MVPEFIAGRGKGSHGTVYLGRRRTTLKDRRKEIGKGLLNAMLADLGIDLKDF